MSNDQQDERAPALGAADDSGSFVCDMCGRTLPQARCTYGHNFGAGPLYACDDCHAPQSAPETLKSLERFIKTANEN